ncbi:predicted protein [Postia placenta Mad-698-R]|uniref:Uncharacterized protein n=1 Tax=Postia placenta MAD-698-R-SB12 TaxID=670580 RepID=A0A1X6MX62_9APHY|nr:hypothetical protein POSPLADRAFT_1146636 [Postia placenta MAD-698-R-SB12]EED80373.1 predicted protein [Postia placenta Mad-698-R]OSX60803.1 hypothetical protein POSPLADRAFT_1146636 [Postia placenta MAD-698-R-SB12]
MTCATFTSLSHLPFGTLACTDGQIVRFTAPPTSPPFVAAPWAARRLGKRVFESKTQYRQSVRAAYDAHGRHRTLGRTLDAHNLRRIRLGEVDWVDEQDGPLSAGKRKRLTEGVRTLDVGASDEDERRLTFKVCTAEARVELGQDTRIVNIAELVVSMGRRDNSARRRRLAKTPYACSTSKKSKGKSGVSASASDVFGPVLGVLGDITNKGVSFGAVPTPLVPLRRRRRRCAEPVSPSPIPRIAKPCALDGLHAFLLATPSFPEQLNGHLEDANMMLEGVTLCGDEIPTVLAPVPFDLDVMDGFDILFPQPVPTVMEVDVCPVAEAIPQPSPYRTMDTKNTVLEGPLRAAIDCWNDIFDGRDGGMSPCRECVDVKTITSALEALVISEAVMEVDEVLKDDPVDVDMDVPLGAMLTVDILVAPIVDVAMDAPAVLHDVMVGPRHPVPPHPGPQAHAGQIQVVPPLPPWCLPPFLPPCDPPAGSSLASSQPPTPPPPPWQAVTEEPEEPDWKELFGDDAGEDRSSEANVPEKPAAAADDDDLESLFGPDPDG